MPAFVIPGRPVAKNRALRFANGHAYRTAESEAYEAQVSLLAAAAVRRQQILDGPVGVLLDAVFPDRRSLPDADGIAKATLDAMRRIVYRDDRQVSPLLVLRRVEKGAGPLLRVRVDPVEPGDVAGWLRRLADAIEGGDGDGVA